MANTLQNLTRASPRPDLSFLQPAAFDLARLAFSLKPVIIDSSTTAAHHSYSQTRTLKELCLHLFLFILSEGHPLPVLNYVTSQLQASDCQADTNMDVSLIRFFVSHLLSTISPPYSDSAATSLGRLLLTSSCSAALSSEFFDGRKRPLLEEAVEELLRKAKGLTAQEKTSIASSYRTAKGASKRQLAR